MNILDSTEIHQLASGSLAKMRVEQAGPVNYFLRVGSSQIHLNPYLGKYLRSIRAIVFPVSSLWPNATAAL